MLFKSIKSCYVLLCIPLLLSLSGCVHVTSTTFANKRKIQYGFPVGSSFCIVPAQNANKLFVKEVEDKITGMLEQRNYFLTDAESADYYLTFDFGMDQSTRMVSSPRYVSGQTKTTHGDSYYSGSIRSNGYQPVNSTYNGCGNHQKQSKTSGTVVYVPEEVTTFSRNLTMTVYDAKRYRSSKTEEQLWRATANSFGRTGDLRLIIDYLLKSVFKNFGKDTEKNVYDTWWNVYDTWW